MSNTDRERARLRWRCRRGMRELDRLLERWLERHFINANAERRAAFERLLQCEDDQIWAWATGRARPDDPALATLMDQILEP